MKIWKPTLAQIVVTVAQLAVGTVPAQQKAAPQTDPSGQAVQPAKAQETTQKKSG